MTVKSIRGIYYQLEESTYKVTNGILTFHFSSNVTAHKFVERHEGFREKMYEKFTRHIGPDFINLNVYFDYLLYKKMEKRGFYLTFEGRHLEEEDLPQLLSLVKGGKYPCRIVEGGE